MNDFADSAYGDSTVYRPRSSTLLGGLPPPSITGLRPVNRSNMLSQHRGGTADYYTSGLHEYRRFPRTVSEGARHISGGTDRQILGDAEMSKQYPTVQGWLKPATSLQLVEEKVGYTIFHSFAFTTLSFLESICIMREVCFSMNPRNIVLLAC